MSNKIGRFEILSELAHSDIGSVYKASDPESGQTVALKAIRLAPLGEQAPNLVKSLLEEADTSKVLNSHNIALLYGAGEMDGHLCASMEYVQGNSIATMLARKEGFSIWDLQDIARQSCQGLDHAQVRKVVHYSLEPAKIMVQWDGIVKILSFGVSSMGSYAAQASGNPPAILHYMSPEQLRGDPLDARSNLFSLGAILYEMVSERKAFGGENADQVRAAILEMTPTAPDQINRKIHPALTSVIMKALAKTPEERYQSGQELVNDLEKCKESAAKSPAKPAVTKPEYKPVSKPPAAKIAAPAPSTPAPAAKKETTPQQPGEFKVSAAAAGWGETGAAAAGSSPRTPALDPTAQFISNCVKATVEAASNEQATMSAATVEAPEVHAPRIAVDPMMDERRQPGVNGPSFSDIQELPPLKEVHVEPAPPAVDAEPEPVVEPAKPVRVKTIVPRAPKVPASVVAKKAVNEIKQTPPKLFIYGIGGAVAVMLLIIGMISYRIHSEDSDEDTPAAQSTPATASTPAPQNPAPAGQPATPTPAQITPAPPVEATPAVSVTPKYASKAGRKKAKTPPPAAPAIIPGQLNVESNPPGAQIQIDGQSTNSITPFNVAGLMPGQHTIVISKTGYATETRTMDVLSGSRSMVSVQLAQLMATLSASSDPPGAAIWVDGKDSSKVTPAEISVNRPGNHTITFKKQGYLDETTSANLQIGQTLRLTPTLRALGNTDEIRVGGRFKKLFGGSDTAGMGTVTVKTQPKGAQVAVNNRIVDKMSPVEFYLNPGNYEVDISMSGFKDVHKVITVEKNGKVAIEENLDRQ